MTKPLVELRGVCKAFGNKQVLDNVDLVIYPQDALVILGPSGTGKSTILRIIAGLLAPDQGEVYVAGERRQGLRQDGLCQLRMSMVFQQSALFDSLTVAENVGFYLYQHTRLPEARIREIVSEKISDGRPRWRRRPLPSPVVWGDAQAGEFCPVPSSIIQKTPMTIPTSCFTMSQQQG